MKLRFARSRKQIKKFCRVILEDNLHCWGDMQSWSRNFLERVDRRWIGRPVLAITLAMLDGRAIGAAMVVKDSPCTPYNVGVYVKGEYRRRGIGTNLLHRLRDLGFQLQPWNGHTEVRLFYKAALKAA